MFRAFAIRSTVVLLAAVSCVLPARAEDASPNQVVARFQEEVLSIMKEATKLGVKGRYDRILPAIEQAFLVPLMVQIAVGPHWKTAEPAQRQRTIEAFRRMSASTLATMIDGYSEETFHILGDKSDSQEDARLIETELRRPSGDPVDISYRAKKVQGRWYLVDVIVAGGITELETRKSEYRRILKEGGIEMLITSLNAKADQLLKTP